MSFGKAHVCWLLEEPTTQQTCSVDVFSLLCTDCVCLAVTNSKAVFGGDNGHRDEVLSVSVHGLGNCILSAGMDHSIKVWALDSEDVTEAIKHKNNPEPRRTVFQEGPIFSTYRVHSVRELLSVTTRAPCGTKSNCN